MKIRQLKIKSFRNLRDFEINFTQDITMLLGKNGSAKSNLIEAIAIIFSDIELGESPSFDYYLHYECNSRTVKIDAKFSQETSRVKIDDEEIDYDDFVNETAPAQFSEDAATEKEELPDEESSQRHRKYAPFFPSNVFIYYSGQNNRLKDICDEVKEKYETELREGNDPRLRRVFLTDGSHSSLILFTFFADGSQWAKDFLRNRLGITELLSARLSLERPEYLDTKERAYLSSRREDEKYWHASGRVLKTLKMLQQGSIPLRDFRKVSDSAPEILSRLHFYFGSYSRPDALHGKLLLEDGSSLLPVNKGNLSLSSALRPKDLFQQLDDLRLDGYGLEMHFRLKLERANESVSLTNLSEGEQQLLTVIGLLRFTKENDTLFLLDEPDTHLNPQWSYEYKKMLEEAMENASGSQIIMATHDPVLIAGLTKENVRLMERKGQAEAPDEAEFVITAHPPNENPRGMGVARILTSPMFGLHSILDEDTLRELSEKRDLAFKKDRTPQETERLKELVRKLQEVDMTSIIEDPLYTLFVKAVVRHPDYLQIKGKLFLDAKEFAALERIAKEVAEEMLQQAEEDKL